MSAALALAPPSTQSSPDSSTKENDSTFASPDTTAATTVMPPTPEVRLNGRRASAASLRAAVANGGRPDDGWGSNFWVTLVDPQVRLVPVLQALRDR